MYPAYRIAFIRLVLLACGAGLTYGFLQLLGIASSFPPDPRLACMYFTVVNLICLWLIKKQFQADGTHWKTFLGFEKARLHIDCAWALLWLVVLYIPFFFAIMLVPLAIYGVDGFQYLETAFIPAQPAVLPAPIEYVLVIAVALLFPLFNAPVEEIIYRGFALQLAPLSKVLALTLQAFVFALHHVLLAPTPLAAAIYLVAFFIWGLGAGIIVLKQRRLMPMVLSHFIINFAFSIPALFV